MSSILAKRALVCHPDTPSEALVALGAQIGFGEDGWEVEFLAAGDPGQIRLPAPTGPVQTDGLWHSTCFEMFLALADDAYIELNFSPSCAWAAYHFDHYRTGMRAIEIPAPQIAIAIGSDRMALTARLPEEGLPWSEVRRVGLSAVIEDRTGAISYWALAHPPGRPDFHHRDCFTLELPPVDRG